MSRGRRALGGAAAPCSCWRCRARDWRRTTRRGSSRTTLRAANGAAHLRPGRPPARAVRVPLVPVSPIERRYAVDRSARLPIGDDSAPVFLLGADALGRDVLSRTLAGDAARRSASRSRRRARDCPRVRRRRRRRVRRRVGRHHPHAHRGVRPRAAGRVRRLALRGSLPLVLSSAQVFAVLVLVFGLAGWPAVARGIRGIVRTEARQEYQKLRTRSARPPRAFSCAICSRPPGASSSCRRSCSCPPSSSPRPRYPLSALALRRRP